MKPLFSLSLISGEAAKEAEGNAEANLGKSSEQGVGAAHGPLVKIC